MKNEIPLIIKGEGKPLIFLHGFMANKEIFLPQIDYFSKYFKVYAYDLCGFGENTSMPYPYDLDDYVGEFLSIYKLAVKNGENNLKNGDFTLSDYSSDSKIEKNGGILSRDEIETDGKILSSGESSKKVEKVSVIAHSFGARVILKAASRHDIFDKIVLCGAAGLKRKFSLKRQLKKCAYKISRPFFKRDRLEKIFFSSDYNMTSGNSRESFKLVTSEYLDDCLEKINCDVLAINGDKDGETPLYLAKKLENNIKNCRLYIMKDCGHFCFIDDKTQFNYLVREFLL